MTFPMLPTHTISEVLDVAVRVVAAVQVALMTDSVPPGSSIPYSTRLGSGAVVVPVSGGKLHSQMISQRITFVRTIQQSINQS